MNPAFALGTAQADRNILNCPTKAGHGMTLKMGQHQITVIFREMRTHKILFQLGGNAHRHLHRQTDGAVFVQNLEVRNGGEAVVLCHLIMQRIAGTGAAIGSVALHNGAVHQLHQIFYQIWGKVVAGWRFAGGKLNGNFIAIKLLVQSLIRCQHSLWGNILGVINLGLSCGVLVLQRRQGNLLAAVGGDVITGGIC